MWGVLRHPNRFVRPGGFVKGTPDSEALAAGESRRVNCFLRATFSTLPRRLTQGRLTLSPVKAVWAPSFGLRRTPIEIRDTLTSVTSRVADHREPGIKNGGRARGVIAIPAFSVVSCIADVGVVDLVVPSVDEGLVAGYFKKRVGT